MGVKTSGSMWALINAFAPASWRQQAETSMARKLRAGLSYVTVSFSLLDTLLGVPAGSTERESRVWGEAW